MPTTTKMGIVYPSSTDLVKDGATAMGTISTTVDAKTGLVLLNTTTFSAVSSQSINDVFSTNFDYYFLTGSIATSDSLPEIRMRLRVSGSDNTSGQYRYQIMEASGGTAVGGRTTGATFWTLGRGSNTTRNFFNQQINNPFSSTIRTSAYGLYQQIGDGNLTNNSISLAIDVTTSYTGLTIYPESGTMTGTVSIYGYNK